MVHRLLREHIDQEVDYKVIVFCTAAMVTEFMYIMLRDLKLNVIEINLGKPQLYRTRVSEELRDSNRLILVTSDVSTRGVNYPDVTPPIGKILCHSHRPCVWSPLQVYYRHKVSSAGSTRNLVWALVCRS
ncbi:hypothetical protein CFC21_103216 [Triticum aestivum]|uniref:Helicase C-terminal domain-containing protein n=3 Tax=Triticum TaxID=4564 RepID=A0A9R1C112_TRITD|nr:hypothetical protein CFC21_103216 [Triticum aestivum]VAI88352.1 unnamed protein product [Triticum turgidum subsp. durum]